MENPTKTHSPLEEKIVSNSSSNSFQNVLVIWLGASPPRPPDIWLGWQSPPIPPPQTAVLSILSRRPHASIKCFSFGAVWSSLTFARGSRTGPFGCLDQMLFVLVLLTILRMTPEPNPNDSQTISERSESTPRGVGEL